MLIAHPLLRHRSLFSLAILVVATNICLGQQPSNDDVVRINTDLVVLDALVIDKKTGHPVRDLKANDFDLFVDDVKQPITYFSEDQLPLSVVLLLDVSGSVVPFIEQIGQRARTALEKLKSQDEVAVMMQVSFAGTGIWLSDGATNIMPVAPHRFVEGNAPLTQEQIEENRAVVHRAWKLHYDHIQHSLVTGFYQGWDLHPAQLPTRYAAVYAFFLESLEAASERLKNFVEKAAKATLVGDVFDDAATGQGLLNYFLRAINCGAITEEEALELSGLTLQELRSASFVRILKNRQEL